MLISFIVPVYNVDLYLAECIESLMCQSELDDIEIILVDDGSTDQSGEICDYYKKIDRRIIVIHQNNKGVSVARNVGIDAATGDWLAFVDGDDKLVSDFYKIMKPLTQENCDIIVSSYLQIVDNVEIPWGKGILNDNDGKLIVYEGDNLDNIRLNCLYQHAKQTKDFFEDFGYPWAKLYRASVIKENGCYFVEGVKKHEDTLFNITTLKHVHRIIGVRYPLYCYRQHEMSVSYRFLPDYEELMIVMLQKQYEIISQFYPTSNEMKNREYAIRLIAMIWIAEKKGSINSAESFLRSAIDHNLFYDAVFSVDKRCLSRIGRLHRLLLMKKYFKLAAVLTRFLHAT